MLIDSLLVSQRLGGGRNQWDDSVEAMTKLSRVCDIEEYKGLEFLGKPLAASERGTLDDEVY
jgi:hypothetical protein